MPTTLTKPSTRPRPLTARHHGPRPIAQYTRRRVLAVWAAAAIPMGVLAWVVAPAIAGDGPTSFPQALIVCLTVGLVWQFALVAGLVAYEQRTLRWSRVRRALWLQRPESPRTGRVGGRTWFVIVPLILAFGVASALPSFAAPTQRDFGAFLGSNAGRQFFSGSWGWFLLMITMFLFNTVLGEELLFRGLLLPRMRDAFGSKDWLANAVLFAAYHVHIPWAMPRAVLHGVTLAYPTRRYRSAWIGIAVHSVQSVFLGVALLTLVVAR